MAAGPGGGGGVVPALPGPRLRPRWPWSCSAASASPQSGAPAKVTNTTIVDQILRGKAHADRLHCEAVRGSQGHCKHRMSRWGGGQSGRASALALRPVARQHGCTFAVMRVHNATARTCRRAISRSCVADRGSNTTVSSSRFRNCARVKQGRQCKLQLT